MLTHPTLDLLHDLGLHGMAKGFKVLEQATETRTLEHAEWLGLLLEYARPRSCPVPQARGLRLHPRTAQSVDHWTNRAGDIIHYLPTSLIFKRSLSRVV